MPDIDRRSLSLLGLATMLSPASAFAADYPTRPIHLIVGFTPGASSDIVARLYAKGAGPMVGQEMVVENKTGAGSSIAAGFVARASSDGYTLVVLALSTLTYKIVPSGSVFRHDQGLRAGRATCQRPACHGGRSETWREQRQEFTALAKSKPGQILFGTVGPGSLPDLAGELYAQRAGVKLVQVPYPGSPQVTTDLIGGRIMMSFQITSAIIGQIKNRTDQGAGCSDRKTVRPHTRCADHGGSGNARLQYPAVVRPRRARGYAASGDRQACRGGETGDACARYGGVAAQGRLRPGSYGAGSVRRFHQKRNHALVRRCEHRRHKGMKLASAKVVVWRARRDFELPTLRFEVGKLTLIYAKPR